MQRFVIVVLCGIALGVSIERVVDRPVREPLPNSPVIQTLGRAIANMDRGRSSLEYRESIEFLRAHEVDTIDAVREVLHEQEGSFAKWQIAYVLGELGGAHTVQAIRAWLARPLPVPERGTEGSHRVDLSYSEEFAARAQGVSSIARIAGSRPALHDQAVSNLIEIAKRQHPLKDAAIFELRGLLGDDFESLRAQFGPEDARYFEPFMPPAEWQGLLQRRLQRHQQETKARAQSSEALCRAR
ncbi:MAG: hypothetical protein ACN4G0_01775 [Polyangiales bacterium]